MIPEITRYRKPRARVAIAYSTKDRIEFTKTTIGRLINNASFDLYWFDGSVTPDGRALPLALCPGSEAACELHQNVVGGPDSAIIYALRTLQPLKYDITILIENDVLVSEGWYEAMSSSMGKATQAGFRVAAATARVYAQRVLSYNGDYCLMLNSGAGCIALTPPAITILLEHYRTVDGTEFLQRFESLTGIDLRSTVEFSAAQRLSCDFFFDLALYLHGYVVTSPAVTFATTIDGSDTEASSNHHLVKQTADHIPVAHDRLTRPNQIKGIPYPFFRFARSRQSNRLLIGCQQLSVTVNEADDQSPVQVSGAWRRRWLQSIGPFALSGRGHVHISLYEGIVGLLLVIGHEAAELRLTTSSGHQESYKLAANILADVVVNANDPQAKYVDIDFDGGDVAVVGLTAEADVLSYYANAYTRLEHLPS